VCQRRHHPRPCVAARLGGARKLESHQVRHSSGLLPHHCGARARLPAQQRPQQLPLHAGRDGYPWARPRALWWAHIKDLGCREPRRSNARPEDGLRDVHDFYSTRAQEAFQAPLVLLRKYRDESPLTAAALADCDGAAAQSYDGDARWAASRWRVLLSSPPEWPLDSIWDCVPSSGGRRECGQRPPRARLRLTIDTMHVAPRPAHGASGSGRRAAPRSRQPTTDSCPLACWAQNSMRGTRAARTPTLPQCAGLVPRGRLPYPNARDPCCANAYPLPMRGTRAARTRTLPKFAEPVPRGPPPTPDARDPVSRWLVAYPTARDRARAAALPYVRGAFRSQLPARVGDSGFLPRGALTRHTHEQPCPKQRVFLSPLSTAVRACACRVCAEDGGWPSIHLTVALGIHSFRTDGA
jgi:hypothetical protein